MKKKLTIAVIIVFCINFCTCKFISENMENPILDLFNNANHSIGCYFAIGGEFGTVYPDTSLPMSNRLIQTEVKPKSKYYLDVGVGSEELYSRLPQGILSVFIFHTDTLRNNSWESVRSGYKILKRYDLSLEQLKKMDKTITYP